MVYTERHQKSGRVGTSDLTLTRRVQLAVVAHIRHNYTDYDHLLRVGSWWDARKAVEHACLDKLVRWRAEDDDNTDAMSDILREVVVISDDEEEDSVKTNLSRNGRSNHSRDPSVEIISSQANFENLGTEKINVEDIVEVQDEETHYGEARPYADTRQSQYYYRNSDRSDRQRRQVWQNARMRRGKALAITNAKDNGLTVEGKSELDQEYDKINHPVDVFSIVSELLIISAVCNVLHK